jgi:hypothetical protein
MNRMAMAVLGMGFAIPLFGHTAIAALPDPGIIGLTVQVLPADIDVRIDGDRDMRDGDRSYDDRTYDDRDYSRGYQRDGDQEYYEDQEYHEHPDYDRSYPDRDYDYDRDRQYRDRNRNRSDDGFDIRIGR